MASKTKAIKQQRTFIINKKPCGESSPYWDYIKKRFQSFEDDTNKNEPPAANPDTLPEKEDQENEELAYIRAHWREIKFTKREGQVLNLVASGYNQEAIAKRLGLTQGRVSQLIAASQKKAAKWSNNLPHDGI